MRIFIPYKTTPDDGLECKYTIRSMVKHFKDMTGCLIVGDKPSWYKGDHIYYTDIPNRKEYSIYRKLILIKETVLHLNDDFFALQDFGTDLPNYYSGTCRDKLMVTTDKVYKELYLNCLPEWLNFDIHVPMVIDTRRFDWDIDRPLKTYYGNQNKLTGTRLTDCKIRGDLNYSEVKDRIEGRPFFSTHDNADKAGMLSVLYELYPLKSEYENNN